VPFPALISTLIRRRLQVKPATLLIPIDLFSFLLVEEFRRALSSTNINSHQETASGQACNPPDPH